MEIKVKLPPTSKLQTLPTDVQQAVIPWATREAPGWQREIQRRVQSEHTGTDTTRTKPLPPYNALTLQILRERGDSTAVDYTRTGALWRSIQPRIMVKDGKVRITIAPYGPHRPESAGKPKGPSPKGKRFRKRIMEAKLPALIGTSEAAMEQECAIMAGWRFRQYGRKSDRKRWELDSSLGSRVIMPGVKFRRRAHTRFNPSTGTTSTVRAHYAQIPMVVPSCKPTRAANPWHAIYGTYAWRFVLQEQDRGLKVRAYGAKMVTMAQEVANGLAARLGNGEVDRSRGARPNPWLQFHPKLLTDIKGQFVKAVLDNLARDLFR